MKRINTYTTALLLTVALTGCSREAESPERPLIDGQIRISSQIEGQATGRAIAENGTALTGVQFLRKDMTTASTPSSYVGTVPLPGNRLTSGEIVFTGTVPMYDKTNLYAIFMAYWPKGTPNSDRATWVIDGKTDILISGTYSAGKLTSPNTATSGTTMMTFYHKLAQLEVVCKADPAATPAQVANTWGKITKIEVIDTHSNYTFHYGITTYTDTFQDLALLQPDYNTDFAAIDIPANSNTTANAAAMIAAKSSNTVKLRITTERQDVQEITATLSGILAIGMRHTVPLIFKWDGKIELGNSTIAEWNNGGTNLENNPIAKGKPIIEYGIPPYDIKNTLPAATLKSYNYYTNDAANAANNGGYMTSISYATAEAPYAKLEIATEHEKNSSGNITMNWAEAWTACKNKTTGGSGWRLPRQSEMLVMTFNKGKLAELSGFNALINNVFYHTGTECSSTTSGYVNVLPSSLTYSNFVKSTNAYVRCVREVPLDPVIVEYNKQPYSTIGGEVLYSKNKFTATQKGYTTSSYNSYVKGATDASQNGGYGKTLDECLGEVPYRRLEIERYDENPGTDLNYYVMNWAAAWDVCKNKKNGGGGWRLPRMSELMWMFHNRAALSSAPYFVGLNANAQYWSGTEYTSSEMWKIRINDAEITTLPSSSQINVRCVREVPIEPAIVEYGKAPNGNILSGTLSTTPYTLLGATTSSYNGYTNDAANAANNGGYKGSLSASLNEKPYAKLEIAKEDEHSGKLMKWEDAWTLCKKKAPVGEWRLPRISECVLIHFNRSQISSSPYFDSLAGYSWTGTEAPANPASAEQAFYFGSATNDLGFTTKTYTGRARCVRELK